MVYFIRHGQTLLNEKRVLQGRSNVYLTDIGRQTILLASSWLKNHKIDLVLSSPLNRAIESAEILTSQISANYLVDDALIERDYGKYAGLDISTLEKVREEEGHEFIDSTQDWYGIDGVESDIMIFERISCLVQNYESIENILLVTHAGVIKAFLHQTFSISSERSNCFKIQPGSIVSLRRYRSGLYMLDQLISF